MPNASGKADLHPRQISHHDGWAESGTSPARKPPEFIESIFIGLSCCRRRNSERFSMMLTN